MTASLLSSNPLAEVRGVAGFGLRAILALAAEAAVEQVSRDEHQRTGDAERKFCRAADRFPCPCHGEDEGNSDGDECEKRLAAMDAVARDEGNRSQQNDSGSQDAMNPGVARKIGNGAGEE